MISKCVSYSMFLRNLQTDWRDTMRKQWKTMCIQKHNMRPTKTTIIAHCQRVSIVEIEIKWERIEKKDEQWSMDRRCATTEEANGYSTVVRLGADLREQAEVEVRKGKIIRSYTRVQRR